jgi:Protein of unknown function (DUF2877)
LFAGPVRSGRVLAASGIASYVSIDGSLLGLLHPDAVRLPIAVCVQNGALPTQGASVEIGDGVVASDGHAWRPARWWNPRPHVDVDALLAHAGVLLDVVCAEPADSFGLPLDDARTVAASLADGDPVAALCVIGLGPGLTPSGDDVVAGAFAVLAIAGRLDGSVRDAVETAARTRTTALSSALVAAAGRGEMIPQAARLVTSVAAGDPGERVASVARALFAVGSTSGHDLAAGMAGALRVLR